MQKNDIVEFDYKIFFNIADFARVKYLRDKEGIKKIGEKIRELRLGKGLTQEAVAWEAGIEPMQLSKIERGVINTSVSHILVIAKAIKVHPSKIFEDC
jgi:DNA-binding XRE family transcriptional regulator